MGKIYTHPIDLLYCEGCIRLHSGTCFEKPLPWRLPVLKNREGVGLQETCSLYRRTFKIALPVHHNKVLYVSAKAKTVRTTI